MFNRKCLDVLARISNRIRWVLDPESRKPKRRYSSDGRPMLARLEMTVR
jgi:hypothetical protein